MKVARSPAHTASVRWHKLNRSTTSGRGEQRPAKREMVMYPITVVFWLLKSWLWFCYSRGGDWTLPRAVPLGPVPGLSTS
ncbi:hypothetical protein Celaphus_00013661 [Cervus elaphus hippelaphus]|uniref:Mff-like domain-containing protein n=1 Tax=Cervus elaphus hippelaphus TaxID=46360 RepID=A0A212CCC7_CEREH|nr:hypothetical protein Celaphus_00013661 [Cervus elaphus hippelaphus]